MPPAKAVATEFRCSTRMELAMHDRDRSTTAFDSSLLTFPSVRYFRPLGLRLRNGLYGMFPELRLRRLVGRQIAIHSFTTVRERLALFDLATTHTEIGRYVEIGSYLGASTVVLAAAMQRRCPDEGKVFCIDTWENDAMSEGRWSTFDLFCNNIRRWSQLIEPIKGNSQSVELPFCGEVDILFLDGDHSYAGVKKDLDRFAPLIREGGFLALHDQAYYPAVTQAMGELLGCGGWYACLSLDNLTVLRRDVRWQADMTSRVASSPIQSDQVLGSG